MSTIMLRAPVARRATLPSAHRFAWLFAVVAGLAIFLLGVAVYVLDRPAGSAYLLPAAWARFGGGGRLFGPLGAALPSFAHAFSFTLFTALLAPHSRRLAAAGAVFWGAVNVLFELGQHAAVSGPLAGLIGDRFQGVFILDHLGSYFRQGHFDRADVLASVLGAAAAWWLLKALFQRPAPEHLHSHKTTQQGEVP